MNKDLSDKISFLAFIVPAFAEAYKMNMQSAYRYLKQYGGIDFLNRNWWALHTDNEIWAVHDIYEVCRKNGGLR
ncbi:MAG: DUF3791 domain-containing protein [Bacteroidales bacterium]|jgi:hypothetical protein|nr:DUF3791 domain-containing protein [Bacteroidales bacterium]